MVCLVNKQYGPSKSCTNLCVTHIYPWGALDFNMGVVECLLFQAEATPCSVVMLVALLC